MGVETAAEVDTCPERMDAAGAEEVEEATMLSLETAVDICPAVLTMIFFWRTKKKNKQKQEAADEC